MIFCLLNTLVFSQEYFKVNRIYSSNYSLQDLDTTIAGVFPKGLKAPDGDPDTVLFISNNGEVGIGTGDPQGILDIRSNDRALFMTSSSNNTNAVSFLGLKSRGSYTNPTAVLSGDNLFTFGAGGWDGTGWITNRGIVGVVSTANWSSSNRSCSIQFQTTLGTTRGIRMTIMDNGNVGIGVTTTTEKLEVNGTIKSTQYKLSALNTAPATSTSTGTVGEIRITTDYIYICVATNTWKRVALNEVTW
jgi:hypothetical protein